MSEKILKQYKIQTMGNVRIIQETDLEKQKLYGEYYARVLGYGLAGANSSSQLEAEERMLKEVSNYLSQRKQKLQAEIQGEIDLLNRGLESIAEIKNQIPQLNVGGKK
jgi:flagellar hook-associated protein FlgK